MFCSAPGEEEQLVDRIKAKVGADRQPYFGFESEGVGASPYCFRLSFSLSLGLTHIRAPTSNPVRFGSAGQAQPSARVIDAMSARSAARVLSISFSHNGTISHVSVLPLQLIFSRDSSAAKEVTQ